MGDGRAVHLLMRRIELHPRSSQRSGSYRFPRWRIITSTNTSVR